MQIKTFRVPFAEIVGSEATELEFGPDDYVVVRPLFGLSRLVLSGWQPKFEALAEMATNAVDDAAAQKATDKLTLELLATTCLEWHLTDGDDKPIPMPKTSADIGALPGAISAGLLTFLAGYRGADPNPTTPG